jgi:hypothetical protein
MSDPGSLIPMSDEQAKAIQEALKTLQRIGGFLKQTFGTVPEDLVGLLGGDWLKARRLENFARIAGKAQERLKARHVDARKPPRLSILLPLIVAAADEEDDELQDMWARLLAAAADHARAKSFRLAFIETVKKMDPLDAAVIRGIHSTELISGDMLTKLRSELGASEDEIEISIENLHRLELIEERGGKYKSSYMSAFGREFLRTVSD